MVASARLKQRRPEKVYLGMLSASHDDEPPLARSLALSGSSS